MNPESGSSPSNRRLEEFYKRESSYRQKEGGAKTLLAKEKKGLFLVQDTSLCRGPEQETSGFHPTHNVVSADHEISARERWKL